MNILHYIASLKLTLAGILALILGVLLFYINSVSASAWIATPLGVLSINLLAALIVNPGFRRQSGLMIFHVCLLTVMLLATFGWLSNFKGRIEIMEGQSFNAHEVEVLRQGPWHPRERLEAVNFQQGVYRVEYAPELIRGQTESWVTLSDARTVVAVGDNIPLRIDGYRFYTTSNKGYAAVLTWTDTQGKSQRGAIHFPSYPFNDWKQLNDWQTPGGEQLNFELLLTKRPPESTAWVFDRTHNNGSLRVTRENGTVATLEAGEAINLARGQLRFEKIRMWMGYEVFYDPMLAWLFAAALVGIIGLGWHFFQKFGVSSALLLPQTVIKEGGHVRLS